MSRIDEIFNETIEKYNKEVSDFHKFSFNTKERSLFLEMMHRYATECQDELKKKIAEEDHGIELYDSEYTKLEQSILNTENVR